MLQTTTAQNIVDDVSQDVRKVLGNSGTDATIILGYVNRVQQRILRNQRHPFLLSAPKQFVTQLGVTDYWIGTSGSATAGTYDTGLNLTDIGFIQPNHVWDRSNNTPLARVDSDPLPVSFQYQDGTSRIGRPTSWLDVDVTTPNVLSIFPAPDNQNSYQPIGAAPILSTTTSGALSARTYYVRLTVVDSNGGESLPGPEAQVFVPANKLLMVKSPATPVNPASGIPYTKFNVYISTTSGSETKQGTGTNFGSDFTESISGLSAGTPLPTASTIEPLRGYLIEFRYYKTRPTVSSLATVLLIPDDYADIVKAGVNELTFKFLKADNEAAYWQRLFLDGLRQITRDYNLQPSANSNFIGPDPMMNSNF